MTLPPALASALNEVRIDAGGRTGAVGNDQIKASSRREFRLRLANAIYQRWHLRATSVIDDHAEPRRDSALEKELRAAVPHEFSLARVRLLATDQTRAGCQLVERAGVRTWVPTSAVRTAGPRLAGMTLEARVTAVRPMLSPGFFLVDGSRGSAPDQRLRRVYLHIRDAADAISAWSAVLEILERGGARYRAKVIATWPVPDRTDGLTIYLPHDDSVTVRRLASINRGCGQRKASIFAEAISNGIAIADEPSDSRPGMSELSFGEHRARVIADVLAGHAVSPGTRRDITVAAALLDAGIDPLNPARNKDQHEPQEGGAT